MDGRIWAENNTGRGATFAFDLSAPIAFIERDEPTNVADLDSLHLQARPHVLIADDNATNRVVAQALCEMFGCTSETVEDGQEAVEAVQSRPFDLILMDIKMPRLDGVGATRAIRALDGPQRDIPIIALTANADPDDAKAYLAAGMAAVVEKPIKPERLRLAMNTALEPANAAPARARDVAERRSSRRRLAQRFFIVLVIADKTQGARLHPLQLRPAQQAFLAPVRDPDFFRRQLFKGRDQFGPVRMI